MSARLFAALDLPVPVRDALGAFGRAAAADDFALRAVRDDALHVTLAFLGHRALDDIEPAAEAVRAVAAPVADLALGDALWLAPRRPHVLTVEVQSTARARSSGCRSGSSRRWSTPSGTSPTAAGSARTSRSRGCVTARPRGGPGCPTRRRRRSRGRP